MIVRTTTALVVAFCAATVTWSAPQDLYDWIGVAPLIVTGKNLGEDGKLTEFRVAQSLRGTLPPGETIRVAVRAANRDRDRDVDVDALRIDVGEEYVLLLEFQPPRGRKGRPSYRLVRGVRGIRALPPEGAQAFVEALGRFAGIQDLEDDRLVWGALRDMLEETNRTLIETALDQFIRFRRGDADLVPRVVPLLGHPSEALRERSARLLEQIARRHEAAPLPEPERLRQELTARARRDPAVPVRVAATEALAALSGPGIDEILATIARDDPDQLVRFTAERLASDRRGASR